MFQISQSDSGDLRTIGNRDVKNWKEYQQQRGSLDTVRTSICCDSDNIRTTKTSKSHRKNLKNKSKMLKVPPAVRAPHVSYANDVHENSVQHPG
ncbi:hypothetical protein MSG28_010419 [Choristoneura fumiferana]|uniref:Uncharacterized protein n=1 Tax=Choristoneura fumiferana TaxID=7141 RepID=A0ACC0KKC3_CHOFU|nr:hypothetical protein MSG28_010419 [Choristoneura fumiferana]